MADAQQPALPASLLEFIDRRATEQFNDWKSSATEEQKAKGLEELRRFQEEPEFQASEMAKMSTLWAAADADGDGKLNLAEWTNFIQA